VIAADIATRRPALIAGEFAPRAKKRHERHPSRQCRCGAAWPGRGQERAPMTTLAISTGLPPQAHRLFPARLAAWQRRGLSARAASAFALAGCDKFLKPFGSSSSPRISVTEKAISTYFPENDAWEALRDSLSVAAFRNRGSATFPKKSKIGKVAGLCSLWGPFRWLRQARRSCTRNFEGLSVESLIDDDAEAVSTIRSVAADRTDLWLQIDREPCARAA
jgi:hypothetical protein